VSRDVASIYSLKLASVTTDTIVIRPIGHSTMLMSSHDAPAALFALLNWIV